MAAHSDGISATSNNTSPFDKLPNELISRIFTIGTEHDIAEHKEWSDVRDLKPLPHLFISLVGSVCERFHDITCFNKSNAHFYCISAGITQATPAARFSVSQFHWALKVSSGCDIFLNLELGRWWVGPGQLEEDAHRRFILHAFRSLSPYKRQLASVYIHLYDHPSPFSLWILRWFGSDSSFQRLQRVSLRFEGESSETPSVDTSLFDDYRFSSTTEVIFDLPSLDHLTLQLPSSSPFRMSILPHTSRLHSLKLYPNAVYSSPFYDWPAIAAILIGQPTLRSVEFAVQNAASLPYEVHTTMTFCLEELSVVLDLQSLHTIFHTFLFPHLRKAQIFIGGTEPAEESSALWPLGDLQLPLLQHLKFVDLSPKPTRILQSWLLPNLESFYLAVCRDFYTESISKLRQKSPRRLVICLGIGDIPEGSFEPFDLSETEVIEIVGNLVQFQDNLKNQQLGSRSLLHLPN